MSGSLKFEATAMESGSAVTMIELDQSQRPKRVREISELHLAARCALDKIIDEPSGN